MSASMVELRILLAGIDDKLGELVDMARTRERREVIERHVSGITNVTDSGGCP